MASPKADLETESRHSSLYEIKQLQSNRLKAHPYQRDNRPLDQQIATASDDDEFSLINLEKSKALLQDYIHHKLQAKNTSNHTEQPREEEPLRGEQVEDDEEINYEAQLNQEENLKKIESLIGEMIKSKVDSSYVTSSECNYSDLEREGTVEAEPNDHLQQSNASYQLREADESQKVPVKNAQTALTAAQIIKESLPNYEIGNVVCMLRRYLASQHRQTIITNDKILSQNNHPRPVQAPRRRQRRSKLNKMPPAATKPAVDLDIQLLGSSKASKSKQNKLAPYRMKVRQEVEKEIAYVFVSKGYGLVLAKEHIKQDMDGNKYNSLLTSVIRSALRKLCDILTKNMGQPVKVFDLNEERLLRSPMVNCRKWLNRSEQHTFFKIINIAYGMNQEPIYQDEVILLYEKLVRQLEKRSEYNHERAEKRKKVDNIISTNPSNPNNGFHASNPNKLKSTNTPTVALPSQPNYTSFNPVNKVQDVGKKQPENKSIGGPAVQKEIAELFVTFKSEDSVHLLLTKRHPKVNWDKAQIMSILHKLIKIGLKKVLKFKKEYSQRGQNMPSLGLTESLVDKILRHSSALQVRVAMVQILMEKTLSADKTVSLITLINSCINNLVSSER